MAITDKTRKILWGRSGNRCAMCRHELVIDATPADDESVVGDECHIVSGQVRGPRHDPRFPADQLDKIENLVLLCRVHHKMVDDQFDTYTVKLLRELRQNHERWVSSTLSRDVLPPPVRVRRIKSNTPAHLVRLISGQDILDIVTNACAYSFDHDELHSEAESDLIGNFLQVAQDWGEIFDELEARQRVEASFSISTQLRELEEAGFWVFGTREVQRLEGGVGAPSAFPVAIMRVIHSESGEIIRVNLQEPTDA